MLQHTLKGDLFGGVTAAVIALPLAIAFGVLAFAPFGPEYTAAGALAGLYGAIFTGIFAALFGGTPSQVTGPTGPMTIVMTSVIASLMQEYSIAGDPALQVRFVLTCAFLCVFMGGVFQIMFGLLRLGSLIKFIPYPVIAGFMNGIAVIIFCGQLRSFAGLDKTAGIAAILQGSAAMQPWTILVGIVTILAMFGLPRFIPVIPGSLLGLGIGTSAYYIVDSLVSGATLGPVIGTIPSAVPIPKQLGYFVTGFGDGRIITCLPKLIAPALTLGVLGSIDSLLTSVVADTVTKTRHDSNRELIGQGIGNLAASLFGGLAGAGATVRTLVNVNAGGRTRLSGITHGVSLLLIVVVCGPLAGRIPMVVLAGILLVTAVKMIDEWSSRLVLKMHGHLKEKRQIALNLVVVLIVTVVTVAVDLMVAVAVGLVAASLLFIAKMSSSIIKRTYRAGAVHSKQVRSPQHMEFLEKAGQGIIVYELDGPLFFGSADALAGTVEAAVVKASWIILDMKEVHEIDTTGAKILQQVFENLQGRGKRLLISCLPQQGHLRGFLQDLDLIDLIGADNFFVDTDFALEFAEDQVLLEAGEVLQTGEMALEQMDIVKDFNAEEIDKLRGALVRETYPPGGMIIRGGTSGAAVFILAKGTVAIKRLLPEEDRIKRLTTFSPGVIFGETAMLYETLHSADVQAEEEVAVYKLK
ncbi:MAG: SLC26A/SulP transporter family protein, partial [Deltaproteobacteria bacterium]|nr:SLC26A/SulP transporter family protein [Deltaproteobacteria bacterium]